MGNRNKEQITPGMTSFSPDAIAINLAGRAFEAVMDSTDEVNRVIEMTPKEGFDLKLELIAGAEDMSTREKLDAIDAAESKYSQDMENNARICRTISLSKAGMVLLFCVGAGILISSPTARKAAMSVVKAIA